MDTTVFFKKNEVQLIFNNNILSEVTNNFLLHLQLVVWERKILTFQFTRHPPVYLYPWGCSSYWPSHCEVKLWGWNCPLSPSEIDNNRNEDIGTTAGKCSSIDGICWNLPLALGVARGPAKSPEWGRRLWPKIINYLMELWLYETSGRMGVGSSRGHLMIPHAILRHLI